MAYGYYYSTGKKLKSNYLKKKGKNKMKFGLNKNKEPKKHLSRFDKKVRNRDFVKDNRIFGQAVFGKKNKIIESNGNLFFAKSDRHGEIQDVIQVNKTIGYIKNYDDYGTKNKL